MLLRTALGRAAAELLTEIVEPGDVLGLAWARSLMAMRTALTRLARVRRGAADGRAVAAGRRQLDRAGARPRAAGRTGRAFFFYAPMVLPDAATAQVLRTQPDIARAIERYPDVTKAVDRRRRMAAGPVDGRRRGDRAGAPRDLRSRRARRSCRGVQLDGEGNPVTTPLTERLIGIDAEQLHAVPDVIAVAYGTAEGRRRARGASAAASSTSLVTHTAMAQRAAARGVSRVTTAPRCSSPAASRTPGLVTPRRGHRAAARGGRRAPRPGACSITSSASASTARRASSASTTGAARCSRSSRARRRSSPIPDWALTDEALVSVAELLRRYHDAVASFDAAGHAWPELRAGGVPRRPRQPQRPEPRQRHLLRRRRRRR